MTFRSLLVKYWYAKERSVTADEYVLTLTNRLICPCLLTSVYNCLHYIIEREGCQDTVANFHVYIVENNSSDVVKRATFWYNE